MPDANKETCLLAKGISRCWAQPSVAPLRDSDHEAFIEACCRRTISRKKTITTPRIVKTLFSKDKFTTCLQGLQTLLGCVGRLSPSAVLAYFAVFDARAGFVFLASLGGSSSL
jgi:hypothetical protein